MTVSRDTRGHCTHRQLLISVVACAVVLTAGCGSGDAPSSPRRASAESPAPTPAATGDLDRVVKVEGRRGLYVRCTGTGSPTVVMEGGDEDASDSLTAGTDDKIFRVDRVDVRECAELMTDGHELAAIIPE